MCTRRNLYQLNRAKSTWTKTHLNYALMIKHLSGESCSSKSSRSFPFTVTTPRVSGATTKSTSATTECSLLSSFCSKSSSETSSSTHKTHSIPITCCQKLRNLLRSSSDKKCPNAMKSSLTLISTDYPYDQKIQLPNSKFAYLPVSDVLGNISLNILILHILQFILFYTFPSFNLFRNSSYLKPISSSSLFIEERRGVWA